MDKRPNIVFCMCDQLRWTEVGCYGHPTIRTPAIDSLAARGVRFETAVSTNPICMPSRSSLLSGQYSRTCNGALANNDRELVQGGFVMAPWPASGRPTHPETTLPESLRAAGYRTAAIGKWHLEPWPQDIGFDYSLIPAVQHAHTGQVYSENGGPPVGAPGYNVDFEADKVREFLAGQRDATEPFFLYYNISPPHMPLADAPDHYTRMYSRDDVVVRPNVNLSKPIKNWREECLTYLWDHRYYTHHFPYAETMPRADFDLLDLHAMYMGLTTWVDDTVARLLQTLRDQGLDENTIVIFTSDHGDNLGSHGLMSKGTFNDESIRVPLVVAGPGMMRGQVCPQVTSLLDLAPTMLELAGAKPPEHMQGRSVAPVLRGEAAPSPDARAFIESEWHGIAIRTASHLVTIPWREKRVVADAPSSVFDLRADPFELNNLAGHEDDEARALTNELRIWNSNTQWMSAK